MRIGRSEVTWNCKGVVCGCLHRQEPPLAPDRPVSTQSNRIPHAANMPRNVYDPTVRKFQKAGFVVVSPCARLSGLTESTGRKSPGGLSSNRGGTYVQTHRLA